MLKYYQLPIKIISMITLAAFIVTQCGLSYAYSGSSASKIRQTNPAQSETVNSEIASAIGAPVVDKTDGIATTGASSREAGASASGQGDVSILSRKREELEKILSARRNLDDYELSYALREELKAQERLFANTLLSIPMDDKGEYVIQWQMPSAEALQKNVSILRALKFNQRRKIREALSEEFLGNLDANLRVAAEGVETVKVRTLERITTGNKEWKRISSGNIEAGRAYAQFIRWVLWKKGFHDPKYNNTFDSYNIDDDFGINLFNEGPLVNLTAYVKALVREKMRREKGSKDNQAKVDKGLVLLETERALNLIAVWFQENYQDTTYGVNLLALYVGLPLKDRKIYLEAVAAPATGIASAIGANIHSNNEIYLDKLQAALDECVEPVQARLRQSGVNCAIKPIIVGSAYALSDDQNTVDANKIGDIDIWLEIDNKDVGSAAAREYATELTARLQGVVSGSVVLGPRFDSHSNAISERVTIYGFFTDQTKGLPVNIGVADDIASRLAAGTISTSKSYLENAGDDSDIIRDFWARKFITAWLSAERFAGNTDTHRRMRQFYLDNFQNPEMVAQEIIDSGRAAAAGEADAGGDIQEIAKEIERTLAELNPGRSRGYKTEAGIFLPSNLTDVAEMLSDEKVLGNPQGKKLLVLGSGDGGVAILARKMGFDVTAVEYDGELFNIAYDAELEIFGSRAIKWLNEDFMALDFSDYDVFYYFSDGSNDHGLLELKLEKEMKLCSVLIVYSQIGNLLSDFDEPMLVQVKMWDFPSEAGDIKWLSYAYVKSEEAPKDSRTNAAGSESEDRQEFRENGDGSNFGESAPAAGGAAGQARAGQPQADVARGEFEQQIARLEQLSSDKKSNYNELLAILPGINFNGLHLNESLARRILSFKGVKITGIVRNIHLVLTIKGRPFNASQATMMAVSSSYFLDKLKYFISKDGRLPELSEPVTKTNRNYIIWRYRYIRHLTKNQIVQLAEILLESKENIDRFKRIVEEETSKDKKVLAGLLRLDSPPEGNSLQAFKAGQLLYSLDETVRKEIVGLYYKWYGFVLSGYTDEREDEALRIFIVVCIRHNIYWYWIRGEKRQGSFLAHLNTSLKYIDKMLWLNSIPQEIRPVVLAILRFTREFTQEHNREPVQEETKKALLDRGFDEEEITQGLSYKLSLSLDYSEEEKMALGDLLGGEEQGYSGVESDDASAAGGAAATGADGEKTENILPQPIAPQADQAKVQGNGSEELQKFINMFSGYGIHHNYVVIPKETFVEVRISDEGPGIPEDDLSKIFQTGFSIVHDEIKKRKGIIEVVSKTRDSKPYLLYETTSNFHVEEFSGDIIDSNHGTVFVIRLPRKARARLWTKESIVDWLKNPPLVMQNGRNRSNSMDWRNAGYKAFVAATTRLFKKWRAALLSAGINPINSHGQPIQNTNRPPKVNIDPEGADSSYSPQYVLELVGQYDDIAEALSPEFRFELQEAASAAIDPGQKSQEEEAADKVKRAAAIEALQDLIKQVSDKAVRGNMASVELIDHIQSINILKQRCFDLGVNRRHSIIIDADTIIRIIEGEISQRPTSNAPAIGANGPEYVVIETNKGEDVKTAL